MAGDVVDTATENLGSLGQFGGQRWGNGSRVRDVGLRGAPAARYPCISAGQLGDAIGRGSWKEEPDNWMLGILAEESQAVLFYLQETERSICQGTTVV